MGVKKDARRELAVEREKELIAFREGRLPFYRAEEITAELCAAGDRERNEAARKLEKQQREIASRRRQSGM